MSTAERQDGAAPGEEHKIPRGREHLRGRRRDAQRRRHLARVDVGIGLLGALILVLAAPGLAITAVVALIVLIAIGIAYLVEHRIRARRGGDPPLEPPDLEIEVRRGERRD
jgi:hypothetical protein